MSARLDHLLQTQLAARPDAPAFSDDAGHALSYAGLDAASAEIGARLVALGVKPGDRVLLLSENCCAAVTSLFAAWRIGAVIVPANARQTQAEIARIEEHCTPAAILATTEVSQNAAAHAKTYGLAEHTGPFGTLAIGAAHDSNPADDTDLAVLLYTTGTTGAPKGVMLSHANVRFGGLTSANLRQMTPDDLIYGVLPITHVFGLCSVTVASVTAGAPVRLAARFDVAATHAALRDGITLFSAVPQMHALLMAHVKGQNLNSPTLRYVSSGAAPLDPTWKREAEGFYGVALQNGWGMTECSAGAAATRNPLGSDDISVGPPLPGVENTVDLDAPGAEEDVGEVLTRGPHVMMGYYRNPDATAETITPEGWLRTGDLGRIDAYGHLHIVGRSKELIIHGGFNVYPPEVEAALNDHPDVIQAAVVGRRIGGDEKVVAFCQVAPDTALEAEALRAFVAERLTGYKRPSQIVLAEALPAAPTGKILKHKLLEHFADELD
ncbi:MAG: class I adenylate-forming enzyme family protein [Pseudomonadota bacterium]